jgi:PmbA protein
MIPTRDLAQAASQALEMLRGQDDLAEAEVFVAANTSLVARIHFTSHIPCNGVEEPKSLDSVGIGIQAVFRAPDGLRLGFGSEPNDLTPGADASGGPGSSATSRTSSTARAPGTPPTSAR